MQQETPKKELSIVFVVTKPPSVALKSIYCVAAFIMSGNLVTILCDL